MHSTDHADAKITRTAMVGLGAMGLQMARHMAAKGLSVAGYDIAAAACAQAAEYGVATAVSLEDVAKHAELLVIMVQTDQQVEDIFSKSALLANLAPGAIICIASSISPKLCQKLAAMGKASSISVLDTPVVLGQQAANDGTMTVFVGGDEISFHRAQPVLQTFGRHVLYLGESGSGQIAKSVNNLLLWATMSANFEALTFARRLGADIPRLIEALAHSSGANWSLSRWGKSTGKWAEKDMDVALELAQELKLPMPIAALVDQMMKTINQDKMKELLA
ncbi:MAG TPA: NAD(P)-dependent oxidoreductase [Acidocella sp.]|nr:NAD(P)-dependent oxidoreductase [Acidocella sp.]